MTSFYLKFSSVFHSRLPYQGKFRSEATPNLHCIFATLSVLLQIIVKGGKQQRWSPEHKTRGQDQGHKKNPRPMPRTAFPRTDTLKAKDRNARGQGQGPRTQAQVLSKKKSPLKNFSGDLQKKRSSQKFFRQSPQKNIFQKIFQALHKILTIQKILLFSSRGHANFRGLEASRPGPRT